ALGASLSWGRGGWIRAGRLPCARVRTHRREAARQRRRGPRRSRRRWQRGRARRPQKRLPLRFVLNADAARVADRDGGLTGHGRVRLDLELPLPLDGEVVLPEGN